jgi:hypothetical protein
MAFEHNSKTSESEPEWGSVDKTALPRNAHADMGEPDKKSTWKFPHHWISGGTKKDENGIWTDGTMYLHKGGLDAAWAAANGARSGDEASEAVKAHLQAHRKALGLDEDNKKTGGFSGMPGRGAVAKLDHTNQVANDQPSWPEVDKNMLPMEAHASGEDGKPETFSYPHHWADGKMMLHTEGLDKAWSDACHPVSGIPATPDEINHLKDHRIALGLPLEEDQDGSSALVSDATRRAKSFEAARQRR